MGGKHFTVPCTVSRNGYGVDTTALIDTGANGFAFMNTTFAIDIAKFLNVKATQLEKPVQVKSYNGQAGKPVTHVLKLHIALNGRRQYGIPFCILDLGSHDIILGRKWMSYFDIWLNVRRRRFVWPEDRPKLPSFVREIRTDRKTLAAKVDPTYQQDVRNRDLAFAQEDARREAGRNSFVPTKILSRSTMVDEDSTYGSGTDSDVDNIPIAQIRPIWKRTHQQDTKDNLRKMQQELKGVTTTPIPQKPQGSRTPLLSRDPPTVDIAGISAVAFHFNMYRRDNEVFTTSLYEIDRIINEREERPAEETDEELVERLLPTVYAGYKDVFSKAASDKLPPHRTYDHKIQLEANNSLGYSPLYRQSTDELKATRQYLIDNLGKGFIEPGQAPFASPILFVKKANGSLRFCIDYRKLNAITRKDRYPLPLIDETLARLSRAKIFTKLDIRQAFHRIRIDPASEDLTTFRTRYGSYKCKVLPFGLTNGPATYQRYMNDVLFDYLDEFCTAYLDDILIYSDNELEHQAHVKKVLERLRNAGLQVDIKKCEFGVERTKYLGFIVTTEGIEVDPEKVEVIRDWKPPCTVKGIQSFLGFCNFYRRFIRDYGVVAKPLV
jgi:hypothetical protein